MRFLPISVNISDKRIVVVGGGRIAVHKIQLLARFTRNITVVAPEISEEIIVGGYTCRQKLYEKTDLTGAFLVYACTNLSDLNRRIKTDAESLNILANVVDDPALCDFVSPAIYQHEHLTVAVGSDGREVRRAIALRDTIKNYLENESDYFAR